VFVPFENGLGGVPLNVSYHEDNLLDRTYSSQNVFQVAYTT
jgi:hypothetical protein